MFISALLDRANVGPLPWAGSPGWCALEDRDPRKLLALAVAGTHHTLRVECAQQARAEASQDVSAAADWSAIGRQLHTRAEYYAARPWMRRAAP